MTGRVAKVVKAVGARVFKGGGMRVGILVGESEGL